MILIRFHIQTTCPKSKITLASPNQISMNHPLDLRSFIYFGIQRWFTGVICVTQVRMSTFTLRAKYKVYIYTTNQSQSLSACIFTLGVQVFVFQHEALGYVRCSGAPGNGDMGAGGDAHHRLAPL